MAGRPPKPIATHEIEKQKLYGNLAARAEVEPRSDIEPRCPVQFSDAEKKAWKYYKQILKTFGLFNIANAPMLDILSRLHAETLVFHEQCKGKPIVKDPQSGGFRVNPIWSARHKNEERIIAILRELGLSSLGLAKLGSLMVKKKQESNGFFED